MIVQWFTALDPIVQALLATCFTWFLTASGAGLVFFFKTIHRKCKWMDDRYTGCQINAERGSRNAE